MRKWPDYLNTTIVNGLALLLGLGACTETHQERLLRLEMQIKAGKATEAIQEINTYLNEQNALLSEPIDTKPSKRLLKNSLDGRIAAWIKDERLHFINGENTDSIELNGQPIDFNLSYSGNFALALVKQGQTCLLQVVDIQDRTLLDKEIPVKCNHMPLVTDDGHFLYAIDAKGITPNQIRTTENSALNLGGGATVRPSLPEQITMKKLAPKYKKIKNRTTLYQVQGRGYVAFRGAAGYYRIYQYPGSGKKITSTKASFARAALYSVYDGDTLPIPVNIPQDDALNNVEENIEPSHIATQSDSNGPDRAASEYLFQKAHAFAYTGSAGKRRLRALVFEDRIKMGKSFAAPVWEKLQFIRDREEFMILNEDRLFYWNPITHKKSQLPLVAHDFVLFDGGLLYVDLTNRLYIRREPFSPAELDLVKLRSQAVAANGG